MKIMKRKNHLPSQSLFNPFWGLQEGVNSLFDNFFQNERYPSTFLENNWTLSIDLKEKNNEYIIKAEVPGLSEEDVNLVISNNCLEISGEKKEEKEEEKNGRHYSEISYGSFYRAIPFEKKVDTEKVQATMNKGLLKITADKQEDSKAKSRKIHITS